MENTNLLRSSVIAMVFLTACSTAPTGSVEQAFQGGGVCENVTVVDDESCVCGPSTAPTTSTRETRLTSALVATETATEAPDDGPSLTVHLWTNPKTCPPCAALEKDKPTEFYCNGEWIKINYVINDGPNPKASIPTATINGQTLSGKTKILDLIQSEIGAMACD
jgi:hypothetical protein